MATQIVSVIKAAGVQKLDEATSAADVSQYIGSLGTEIRAAVGAHCPGLPGS